MTDTTATGSVASSINTTNAGALLGTESTLSNWVGPYVTNMLGQGQALAQTPFASYSGQLTAGTSPLQQSAYSGLAGLAMPTSQSMQPFTPQSFTSPGMSAQYMNPYIEQAVRPQMDEATRQSQIQGLADRASLTKAGAYGGGRGALMESERQRNLGNQLTGIYGKGLSDAYTAASSQFNTEQQQQQQAAQAAQKYGLDYLTQLQTAGKDQRAAEQEALTANKTQYEEEAMWPYKNVQFLQSLLQGLPLATSSYSYSQPSTLSQMLGSANGLQQLYNIFTGTGSGSGSAAKT